MVYVLNHFGSRFICIIIYYYILCNLYGRYLCICAIIWSQKWVFSFEKQMKDDLLSYTDLNNLKELSGQWQCFRKLMIFLIQILQLEIFLDKNWPRYSIFCRWLPEIFYVLIWRILEAGLLEISSHEYIKIIARVKLRFGP